jgi:hypothetical protein
MQRIATNDAARPEEMGGPAMRTFFRIADAWRLSPDEQMTLLGMTSRSTYFKWKKEGAARLSLDLLERLSYVFGIYKDAADPPARARTRPTRGSGRPNAAPPFSGRSALDRLLSGRVADLYLVRRHLDAERSGWN